MSITTAICIILYTGIFGMIYQILIETGVLNNITFILATIICGPYSWVMFCITLMVEIYYVIKFHINRGI